MNNCEHSLPSPPLPTARCLVAVKTKQPSEVHFGVSHPPISASLKCLDFAPGSIWKSLAKTWHKKCSLVSLLGGSPGLRASAERG